MPTGTSMKERRKQPRIHLKAKARIIIRNHTIKCKTCENISEGGMCVVVSEIPPEHSHCTINVEVKNKRFRSSFSSPCVVLWSRPVHSGGKEMFLGLRFTETDEENREKISSILSGLTS